MANVRVYARPGSLNMLPGRKPDFVGYERLPPGSVGGDVSVPGGFSYSHMADGEVVPNTVDVRRFHAAGDVYSPEIAVETGYPVEPPEWFLALTAPSSEAGGDAGGEV